MCQIAFKIFSCPEVTSFSFTKVVKVFRTDCRFLENSVSIRQTLLTKYRIIYAEAFLEPEQLNNNFYQTTSKIRSIKIFFCWVIN